MANITVAEANNQLRIINQKLINIEKIISNSTPIFATRDFNSNATLKNGTTISFGHYAQSGGDNINQQAVSFTLSKKLT